MSSGNAEYHIGKFRHGVTGHKLGTGIFMATNNSHMVSQRHAESQLEKNVFMGSSKNRVTQIKDITYSEFAYSVELQNNDNNREK